MTEKGPADYDKVILEKYNNLVDFVFEVVLPGLAKQKDNLQKIVSEVIGPAAISSIKDEKKLYQVFENIYFHLPMAVSFIISKEVFIDFCQKNRSKMVDFLEKHTTKRTDSAKDNKEPKK